MIEVESLHKAFGGRELWGGLSFKVPSGSVTALVGPNGAGKTTLLNCLGGLDSPDNGQIEIDRVSLSILLKRGRRGFFRDRLVFVFQGGGLVDGWSVRKNLDMICEPQKLTNLAKRQKRDEALSLVGLDNLLEKRVHLLSSGERQRVAIAGLMLKEGDLVLLDEPSSAIDDRSVCFLIEVLLERRRSGANIVIATHDNRLISMCDEIVEVTQKAPPRV